LKSASITKRLIFSVLILELLAGVVLISAVAANERHVRYTAFDANLRAASNALLGAVQEDVNYGVRLDLRGQTLPHNAMFRVIDEHGRLLGSAGQVPDLPLQPNKVQRAEVGGRSYRFFTLVGERVIDPDRDGGIHHQVTIVYGLSDGGVWHEVIQSIRFFAMCTVLLLGITALVLVWLVRRLLSPVHALADASGKITAPDWNFDPPPSASKFVELRPLTSAIEKTIARLKHSMEQQKRFTNDAAHELKTDLAIAKSSLQLLSMKKRTNLEYERGLLIGLDDLTRLERTVQKMLTLARLEQPDGIGGGTCRIDEVLLTTVQQSIPLADLKSISILTSTLLPATVPIHTSDATLLCSNIVLNALQHSPEHAKVEVTSTVRENQVHLVIRDYGEGINEAESHLLFEPFYRGDPSRSRKSGGTGLGLSICKSICDRIGGSISIANHEAGGAVVAVILPTVTKVTDLAPSVGHQEYERG
jgi:signal transduction histidine kinase